VYIENKATGEKRINRIFAKNAIILDKYGNIWYASNKRNNRGELIIKTGV